MKKDLEAVQSGRLLFREFVVRQRAKYRRWASWVHEKYGRPRGLEVEDLVQLALLATWRALDAWDPAKGRDLLPYVEGRAGNAMLHAVDKELGYPRKAKKRPSVRPISFEEEVHDRPQESPRVAAFPDALRAARELSGLESLVAQGVLGGRSIERTAADLYADPRVRLRLRFDSREEAVHSMRRAASTIVRRSQHEEGMA